MIRTLLFFVSMISIEAHGQAVIESSPYARATTQRGFQLLSGAVLENDGQQNLVVNPGFERLSFGWEASGGSFQYVTAAGQFSQGIRGGSWDPSAGSQTLMSQVAPMSYGLVGKPGLLVCETKTQASDISLTLYNATTASVIATQLISASTTFVKTQATFAYPATTDNLRVRFSSASNSLGIFIDNCFIGEPTPIQTSSFAGPAIPDTNNAYDLGSSVAKWRDLWIGRNANIAGTLTVPSMGLGVVHSSSGGLYSSSLVVNADIDAAAAIARTKVASGTANHVVINSGAGVLSSEAALSVVRGGTGLTSIGANGTILLSNGTSYAQTALNTSNVPESGNLYYTDARVRGALSAVSPLSFNSGTGAFSMPQASGSQAGYLSSADYTAFAAKANPGNYITSLTGEATGTGPGATAVTLSTPAVVGKSLTGFSAASGGNVTSADTILSAFGKLENRTVLNDAKVSGFPNPMTTNGDIIIRSGGVATRLPLGAPDQVLTVFGGLPTWRNNPAGFTNPMTSTGDIIYSSDNLGSPARRAIGSTGDYLQVVGGVPTWAALTAANQTLSNLTGPTAVNQSLIPGTNNTLNLGSGANQWGSLFLGTGATFSFLGTGVVKSNGSGVLSSSAVVNADIDAAAAIARTKIAAGTPNQVIINDGSGVLSGETYLDRTRGGTGITSTATFPASGTVATVPAAGVVKSNGTVLSSGTVSLTSEVSGVLPAANGGTGVNGGTAANGQVPIGNGAGFTLSTLTGTPNQVNVLNGAGSITLSAPQDIHSSATPTFGGLTLTGFSGNVIATAGVLSASNGTSNQLFGTNAAGTAPEYKTLSVGTAGTDFNISNAANSVVLNLPSASAANRGAVTTAAQTFAGAKTFNAEMNVVTGINLTKRAEATGATVNALAVTNPFISITGTVTTIGGAVAATDGREITISNASATVVTINNEDAAATAANRFLLPNATALTLAQYQSAKFIYNTTLSRWVPSGGSGSGGGARTVTTFTGTSVAPAASGSETFYYNGASVQTFTGFGTISGLTNGKRVTFLCGSDTNTLLISQSDATNGWLMNGPFECGRGNMIEFEYNSTLARMVELTRNQ